MPRGPFFLCDPERPGRLGNAQGAALYVRHGPLGRRQVGPQERGEAVIPVWAPKPGDAVGFALVVGLGQPAFTGPSMPSDRPATAHFPVGVYGSPTPVGGCGSPTSRVPSSNRSNADDWTCAAERDTFSGVRTGSLGTGSVGAGIGLGTTTGLGIVSGMSMGSEPG